MAHLKKAAGGHLLKSGDGHLVNDCEPPPDNSCNDCDPAIPDTLFVTFSGLGGDWSIYNGKRTLEWSQACGWQDSVLGLVITLGYFVTVWRVQIADKSSCNIHWDKMDAGCTPAGVYSTGPFCIDGGCDDTGSCAASAGATCVVSLT